MNLITLGFITVGAMVFLLFGMTFIFLMLLSRESTWPIDESFDQIHSTEGEPQ